MTQSYEVFSISPGKDKDIWRKIGMGFVNSDESITILLDCLPVSGKAQLRKKIEA